VNDKLNVARAADRVKKETSEGGNPRTFRGDAKHHSLPVTVVTRGNLDNDLQLHKAAKLTFCAVEHAFNPHFIAGLKHNIALSII